MTEIRELHRSQFHAAANLLARAMRDDPMHVAVFGPRALHRLGQLDRFFCALLPVMDQAPLSAWEADSLIGVAGYFRPGTCWLPLYAQLRIAAHLFSPRVGELFRLWRWQHASGLHDLRER